LFSETKLIKLEDSSKLFTQKSKTNAFGQLLVKSSSAEAPQFDKKLILQLESLSLLRFDDEQAVALLGDVVKKAKQLKEVNVEVSV
ncbi:hypothetical protein TELCIR_26033, partial [Teladorsagia circumcincta]